MDDTIKAERTLGFWVLIVVGILLNVLYLLGQTMALINYEFAVSIGLQESIHEITEVGVALNKGFGLGDTFFYMPLFIIGIICLIRRKALGLYMMFGAMAITVYWPIVSLSTLYFAKGSPGWNFGDYNAFSILLSLISIYGLWGMIFLYKKRNLYV